MTHIHTRDRDVNRAIRSWLHEDRHEDASRISGAVLDRLDATPQRRSTWWPARRTLTMNKFATIALAAAAVVAAIFIGAQLLGPANVGGPNIEPTPSATPAATPAPTPTASPAAEGIPNGQFVVTNTDQPVTTTVTIVSPGWLPLQGLDGLTKDDDGLDPPDSVGAAFLAWAWPAGTGFQVYGDPCAWSTTTPETPATTPDEIASALAEQATVDASDPVDVTVGGYAGKAVTVHVPESFHIPDASREERFAECDQAVFGYYGIEGETEPARNAQGGGQIDELWIVDVEGSIVILDAAYSPATPDELVEEMRAMAESATFEVP